MDWEMGAKFSFAVFLILCAVVFFVGQEWTYDTMIAVIGLGSVGALLLGALLGPDK